MFKKSKKNYEKKCLFYYLKKDFSFIKKEKSIHNKVFLVYLGSFKLIEENLNTVGVDRHLIYI